MSRTSPTEPAKPHRKVHGQCVLRYFRQVFLQSMQLLPHGHPLVHRGPERQPDDDRAGAAGVTSTKTDDAPGRSAGVSGARECSVEVSAVTGVWVGAIAASA